MYTDRFDGEHALGFEFLYIAGINACLRELFDGKGPSHVVFFIHLRGAKVVFCATRIRMQAQRAREAKSDQLQLR